VANPPVNAAAMQVAAWPDSSLMSVQTHEAMLVAILA